jgi:hypothetical protein
MSKRVSNSRTSHFRRGTTRARQHVRYGWRTKRRMAIAFALEAQRRLGLETEGVTT